MDRSIEQLLESLPEEERFIVTLHYRSSKSASQISEILGVPEVVVTRMIASSRTKLLKLLSLGE
jgi:RNA polymerase sigma factor (sigma-70 family)